MKLIIIKTFLNVFHLKENKTRREFAWHQKCYFNWKFVANEDSIVVRNVLEHDRRWEVATRGSKKDPTVIPFIKISNWESGRGKVQLAKWSRSAFKKFRAVLTKHCLKY